MIVVTGAVGFIGSNMIAKLNSENFTDIIIVDDFSNEIKNKNLINKKFLEQIHRNEFFKWFEQNNKKINFVFHIGARTDTAEFDWKVFQELNIGYTQTLWNCCVKYNIPLLYASSAATYGLGEFGFKDDHYIVDKLKPLNPYGKSKNDFDKWALKQKNYPPNWWGIKFFNVYGPNEYHKGRMASVIFHAYNQINNTGRMKLFRSHHKNYKDGEQKRDFIYVKDVIDVLFFLFQKQPQSGLYNLGTGQARTFLELTRSTFSAKGIEENITFINTPEDIRDKYQYFTEAKIKKLRNAGYIKDFTSLENGVHDYVVNYLENSNRIA